MAYSPGVSQEASLFAIRSVPNKVSLVVTGIWKVFSVLAHTAFCASIVRTFFGSGVGAVFSQEIKSAAQSKGNKKVGFVRFSILYTTNGMAH